MAKKQLFRGTVEALQRGPVTIEQIAKYTGQPTQFVTRELDRIQQCGVVKNWIIFDLTRQTYSFTPRYKEMNINELIHKIKIHYNKNKDNIDMKMDLIKPVRSYDTDYNMLDKFLSKKDDDSGMFLYPEPEVRYDFSSIEF